MEEGREKDWIQLGWRMLANPWATVSPLDLLKNPMILIAVVGLGFVVGMPYLMDSSRSLFFSVPPHPSPTFFGSVMAPDS